jgi:hypothetical protein
MGTEALRQLQSGFQAHLRRLRLVNLNQKVSDRHL